MRSALTCDPSAARRNGVSGPRHEVLLGFDHAEARTWRHLDTYQFQTHLHAETPRVQWHAEAFATLQALDLNVGRAWTIKRPLRMFWTYRPACGGDAVR